MSCGLDVYADGGRVHLPLADRLHESTRLRVLGAVRALLDAAGVDAWAALSFDVDTSDVGAALAALTSAVPVPVRVVLVPQPVAEAPVVEFSGHTLVVDCPWCKQRHYHGGSDSSYLSDRGAHCRSGCALSYVLRDPRRLVPAAVG